MKRLFALAVPALSAPSLFISLGDCAANGTVSWKVLVDELVVTTTP